MGVLWSRVKEVSSLEIGYTEGKNNWTKYARDLDAVKYFNTPKQNVAWCCTYTSWCFWVVSDKSTALKAQFQPTVDNCGCGVSYNAGYYKSNKRFYTTPKEGDVFFTKGYGHTGFVIKVNNDGTFVTNEGNHNDKVDSVTRKISDMEGFGRPLYDAEPDPTKTVDVTIKAPKDIKVNVNVVEV